MPSPTVGNGDEIDGMKSRSRVGLVGCGRWDDSSLEMPWPQAEAQISERDAALPSLDVLEDELQRAWRG